MLISLWNQIRYQETVNDVHSCFSCTFIRENKNFHFISTLNAVVFGGHGSNLDSNKVVYVWKLRSHAQIESFNMQSIQ